MGETSYIQSQNDLLQDLVLRKRIAFRKELLREQYNRLFNDKIVLHTIKVDNTLADEEFEEFVAYKVLEEQGFIKLYFDRNRELPQESYSIEITPKGILYYESL